MDEEIFLIDGRPVPELKVVELRKELEQRSLPKSGNKKELVDRLQNYLREERAEQNRQQHQRNEQQQQQEMHAPPDASDPAIIGIPDMVAQYLAQQQIQLEAARRDADKHRASTSSTEEQAIEMVQQKESSSEEILSEQQPAAAVKSADATATESVQPVTAEFIPEEPIAMPKATEPQPPSIQTEQELEKRDEERGGGDSEAVEPTAAHRRSASSSETSTDQEEEEVDEGDKMPTMVQNEAEMEEGIDQSDQGNKANEQQYEEQATVRIEEDDRHQMIEEEEAMEESGGGEFVPDEPHGDEEVKSSKGDAQIVESSTKPLTAAAGGGDEELDFEQEIDEGEVDGGVENDDEEEEEEREEPDDRGRKRQRRSSTPSPMSTSTEPSRDAQSVAAKQLQDSQITTTAAAGEGGANADGQTMGEKEEAIGIVDGGLVEVVANQPTTIQTATAKQESSVEQVSSGVGISGRRANVVSAYGRRSSGAAAAESVEQKAQLVEEITPEGFTRRRAVSPARQELSRWIHIRGLKRPFTNNSLLDLLGKFGTVDANAFWIDSIKSNCIVTFETAEQAQLARERLHNVMWPTPSDGQLIVEYSSEEKLKRRKAEEQAPPMGGLDRKLSGGNGGLMAGGPNVAPTMLMPPLMGRGGFGIEGRGGGGGLEGMLMDHHHPSVAPGGLGLTIVVDNRATDLSGPQVHIQHDREQMREAENRKRKAEELEKSQNTLDQLFKKTKTQPPLYFLPLTNEEMAKRYKNKSLAASSSSAANHHKSGGVHREHRSSGRGSRADRGDNHEHGHGRHHSAASSSVGAKGGGRSGGSGGNGREERRGGERERADREQQRGERAVGSRR